MYQILHYVTQKKSINSSLHNELQQSARSLSLLYTHFLKTRNVCFYFHFQVYYPNNCAALKFGNLRGMISELSKFQKICRMIFSQSVSL